MIQLLVVGIGVEIQIGYEFRRTDAFFEVTLLCTWGYVETCFMIVSNVNLGEIVDVCFIDVVDYAVCSNGFIVWETKNVRWTSVLTNGDILGCFRLANS